MGWFAAAAPYVAAAGSYLQAQGQKNATAQNAAIYRDEGASASAQGYEAEATQRRAGRAAIGREVAAAGQAGAGYGGSVGRVIGQSAVNAELDALNIRYKAGLQSWAYNMQGNNLNADARTIGNNGNLRAGAALLKGYSNYSSGTNLG